MTVWMDRSTSTFSQMGGEGVAWIGQAPFTNEKHVFTNLGDGTYFHSGLLAIRAAIAAKVNITYKILYNDAVAMTGGQPVDGVLTVPQITQQLSAEGARQDRDRHRRTRKIHLGDRQDWPTTSTVYITAELDDIQRQLRELTGTSILIYDQTCATEKRRRRKRGSVPRSGEARGHQRSRLRRLRRLLGQIELPVGRTAGHRVRHQTPDQPVQLQ
jgi:indolepyruvate ferredoxin oxidoreductase